MAKSPPGGWWRSLPREQVVAALLLLLLAMALSLGGYLRSGAHLPPDPALTHAPKKLVYPPDRFRAEELARRSRTSPR